tara:strand:- start:5032 stop:6183 length:1152 start_codon:yes stop_codon:yes gene_type:complete
MTSRSRLVAKAFGSAGVLSKATQAVPEAVGGGGTQEVANTSALGTGTAGDQKFVVENKSLYVYDGSEWDQITGGGSIPFVQTEPPTTVVGLDGFTPGGTTDVTMKVIDPDGFPIKYSVDFKADSMNSIEPHGLGYTGNNGLKIFSADSLPFQLDSVSIDQTNGIFKFASRLSDSFAGSFDARLSASDGINTITRVVPVTLGFVDKYDISGGSDANSTTYTAPNGTKIVTSGNSYNTSSYNIKHLTEGPGGSYWLAGGGNQSITLDFSSSVGISKVAYIRIWPMARTDQYSRLTGVYKGNEVTTVDTEIHGSSTFDDLADGSGGFTLGISQAGSSVNSATKGYKDLIFSPHVNLSATPYITIYLYHASGTNWGTSSDEIEVYGY